LVIDYWDCMSKKKKKKKTIMIILPQFSSQKQATL
jgi:hypothetical protein